MRNDDFYTDRILLNQIQEAQEAIDIVNNPIISDAIRIANDPEIQNARQFADIADRNVSYINMVSEFSRMRKAALNCLKVIMPENISGQFKYMSQIMSEVIQPMSELCTYDHVKTSFRQLSGILANYNSIFYYIDNISDEELEENKEINIKIISEIFKPNEESNKTIDKKESAIIILSPVNDRLLKYLSENPEAFYQLKDRKFEEVMAEIYSKLGYKVELTKATRDGGKDIIIRRPEILGDFIYYVECKKYAPNNPVGIGLVKNLVGTVDADRVNGGILATTSYFTPDARKFVIDNKYDYQIQMHDYNKIREMLNQVV